MCGQPSPSPHSEPAAGADPRPPQAPGAAQAHTAHLSAALPTVATHSGSRAGCTGLGGGHFLPCGTHTSTSEHFGSRLNPGRAVPLTQARRLPGWCRDLGLGSAAGTLAAGPAGRGWRGDQGQRGRRAGWSASGGGAPPRPLGVLVAVSGQWPRDRTPSLQRGAGRAQRTDDKKRRESVSGSKSQFC